MARAAAIQGDQPDVLRGIALKVASVMVFVGMASCIKAVGEGVPAGQIVFFRSSMAMVPILFFLLVRGQLKSAFKTNNIRSHFWRGLVGVSAMSCGFYGLTRIPLPDAVALGYAKPLIMVLLASIFLGETIRIYRWSAVIVGFIGVSIISWPLLTIFGGQSWQNDQSIGVLAILGSAVLAAFAMILVRRLVQTEKTPTIVLYFSLSATLLSLGSIPFGWVALDVSALLLLISAGFLGGFGQILLTQSYRYADVSTIAPFEYTSILMALVIGVVIFGDVPQWSMLIGTAIVVGAGIFIIIREHRLGLERRSAKRFTTPMG